MRQILPNTISSILLMLAIFSYNVLFSQVFDWGQDGFTYYETFYPNIDNSGIDIEIYGMETGSPYNNNWVKVGINDNDNQGIQHHYVIKFSETVNLEFMIYNINRDTSGGFCYNDQLILYGNYNILNASNVTMVGDTIFAQWGSDPSYAGHVKLRYENIDSLVINHGKGSTCNPGYINLSPLIINDNVLSSEQVDSQSPKIIKTGLNTYSIKNLTAVPKQIHVYNINGQSIGLKTHTSDGLTIDLENTETGIYFISIELRDGQYLRKKILVQH